MKITLFMAISLNGIIARPDYREDFLSHFNWTSFLDCARQTGALIWGRKTHEKARKYAPQALGQMQDFRKVVVSSDAGFELEPGFELANSPQHALARLQVQGCQQATLAGGSILNSSFAREHLIDEVRMNVEAVIIGRGIPVFAPSDADLRLQLIEVQQLNEKIVQLYYHVIK